MERVTLEAKQRDGLGKNHVRRLRRDGLIPGIVYGRGRDPMPVAVESKALRAALHTTSGMNVLIDLALANGDQESRTVMVKDLQRDIFLRNITHVDFYAIDLTRMVEAHVPITFTGQAAGIAEGGVGEVHLREIVVKCLPMQIPQHIACDVSALEVGDSIHVRDLVMPSDVTVVTLPEEVVVSVVVPKVVEEAAPAATPEAAAATGEAPAAAAATAATAAPGEAKPAAVPEKAEKAKAEAPAKAAKAESPSKAEKST